MAMRSEITQAADLIRRGELEQALPLLQRTVFSFSMKVCGHREDAEDTTQDVLLKSVHHVGKIDDPNALAVWLYKVARNRCWMSRRRSKFAPRQTLSLEDLMPDAAELEALTSKSDPNPEEHTISRQQAKRVHEAVLRIPPQYRFILVLHDMEELDTEEVAKVTGLREGTVRVRLHRARLFVRRELSRDSSKTRKRKGKRLLSKPVECKRLFAGLSDYIDQRVDDLSCEQIEKHLADCPPCVAFVNDLARAVHRCRQMNFGCDSRTVASLQRVLRQELTRLATSHSA
jgi:RNA polymerase sigma-70 factor (ECF subfamily)